MNNHKNKIIFIYKGNVNSIPLIEQYINKVIQLVKKIYVLPDSIEIQFEDMGESVYGMTMLDPRFPNRIRLNQKLSIEELLFPLTHELLHLHQIFTNRLQCRGGNRIIWDKTIFKVNGVDMSYNDYKQLPWELDVEQKQQKLLEFINSNKRHLPKLLNP